MENWKTIAAFAGFGAAALWLAKSKKTFESNMSGTGDDGMPWNTPYPVQRIYRFMVKSAKSKKYLGEGLHSIYWSGENGEWSVGDNFDRLGHIIYDETNDKYIYRARWGQKRISKKNAEALAKSFFKNVEEHMEYQVVDDDDDEDYGFA